MRMIWYAALVQQNSNGYSPFTLYDLSAENQDFPAIRRRPPPQMSMFDPVCVSYETKPSCLAKPHVTIFVLPSCIRGLQKHQRATNFFYTHLSVRGTDNPSSRNQPRFCL